MTNLDNECLIELLNETIQNNSDLQAVPVPVLNYISVSFAATEM